MVKNEISCFSPAEGNHADGQCRTLPSCQAFLGKLTQLSKEKNCFDLLVKSAKVSEAEGKREKMGSICQGLGHRAPEGLVIS